jgi:Transposase DDE domain
LELPSTKSEGKTMPINHLYATLHKQLAQLRARERRTRLRNWTWLLVGLFTSRSVHLSKIANKMFTRATVPSATRRLSRLLGNPAVRVRAWHEPLARRLLQQAALNPVGGIRLVLDGSKIGRSHQLLMVALCYRRRALPIAWTWVRSTRGHSSALKQRALLSYVRQLVPPQAAVVVVGDSEFGAVEVLRQLESWGWHYVLRQKSSHLVLLSSAADSAAPQWQPLGSLLQRAGQRRWLEQVPLTQLHAHATNLLLHWQAGHAEPWLLATNLPDERTAKAAYRHRMWIEEMFGDFKKHGFDLESTHLCHFGRLSRLTLAVSMLYLWLIAYGAQVIKRGLRRLVDRNDRRDYSLFRLGCNMLERSLAQLQPPKTCFFTSSFPKLSGG